MLLDWGTDTEYIGLGYVQTSAVVVEEVDTFPAELCTTGQYVTKLETTGQYVTKLETTGSYPQC